MKLTEESYVLEAKYTWESAEADAENAEYIRTYQTPAGKLYSLAVLYKRNNWYYPA